MAEYRQNADWSESSEGQETAIAVNHGNTRLPYGLCQRHGISLPDKATPRDAWDALKGIGISPKQAFADARKERAHKQGDSGGNADDQSVESGATDENGDGEIDSCKTFNELDDYFQKTHGVSIDSSVCSLDFPAVREVSKGIDIVLREFPQAQGVLNKLTTGSGSGLMWATSTGQIQFNPCYFQNGRATIQQKMEYAGQTGFHPVNSGTKDCGTHETGHILELALIKRQYPNSVHIAFGAGWLAQDIVKPARLAIKKRTKLKVYDITAGVSTYACKNDQECLAECVSDYIVNGENAAPLSIEVWKRLKKELG